MHVLGLAIFGVGCFFAGSLLGVADELNKPFSVYLVGSVVFFLGLALLGLYLVLT